MTMASSIPANLSSSIANNTSDAQMNFNPSWMQSTAPPMQRSLSVSNNNSSAPLPSNVNLVKKIASENETCEPIFAKHSYGREDLLAMMGKIALKPPAGIKRCPFFVDSAQTPIILLPFTDTEMRLQQNMNSSKAMSAKKKPFSRIESSSKGTDIWPRRNVGLGNANSGAAGGCGNAHQQSQTPPETTPITTGPPAVPVDENTSMHNANNRNTVAFDGSSINSNKTGATTAKVQEPSPLSAHAVKKPVTGTAVTTPSSAVDKNTPSPPSNAAVTAVQTATTTNYWCYLDPSGVQRGPFDSHQMQAWFSSGYFSETLQVRRKEETTYITLGELFLINGRETPFKARTCAPPTVQKQQQQPAATAVTTLPVSAQQRISPSDLIESITTIGPTAHHHHHPHISPNLESVQRIWATTPLEEIAVGGGGGAAGIAAPPPTVPVSSKTTGTGNSVRSDVMGGGSTTGAATVVGPNSAAMAEMQNLEEQRRKLREKEELLRRDELERAEKERRLREMEVELKRQQEELARQAREKAELLRRDELERVEKERLMREREAELKRQQEEITRHALEKEMLRRDELERVERERLMRDMESQLKRYQEELNRRARENELLRRDELERAEKERLMRDMEVQLKRHQEELSRRAREKDAEFEQRYAQMVNYERKRRDELAALEMRIRNEHLQQQQLRMQQQQQQSQQQPAVTEQRRGWQTVQMPKPAPIPPAINKQQTTTMSGDGGGITTVAYSAKMASMAVGSNRNNNKKKQQQQQKGGEATVAGNHHHQQKQPKQLVAPVEDKFTAWIIERVKILNSKVDAEVFATFISGIESPNEAEDYIVGYLGDKKEVKEFHRDFLQKRIELRPRTQQAPKDDLSRPAAALGADSEQCHKGSGWAGGMATAISANSAAAAATTVIGTTGANTQHGNNNNNKKKKGSGGGQKGQKVVLDKSSHHHSNKFTVLDPTTLGFRLASDPNRVNAGEIDSVPPVPGGGGNKKR